MSELITEYKMNEEILENFLASKLGITNRAVKIMKSENYSRYEREAIGCLMIHSGTSLEDVLSIFNTNTELLNIKNTARKAVLINEFSKFAIPVTDNYEVPSSELMHTLSFLENAFNGYENDEGEGVRFFLEKPDYRGANYLLKVLIVDITCMGEEYLNTANVKLFGDGNEGQFPLDSILKDIKFILKGFKKITHKAKTHELKIDVEIMKPDDEYMDSLNILNRKGNTTKASNVIKSIDVTWNDVVIRVWERLNGSLLDNNTSFKYKDIEYSMTKSDSEADRLLGICTFCEHLSKTLKFETKEFVGIHEKTVKFYEAYCATDEENELEYYEELVRDSVYAMKSMLLNEISSGLNSSIDNISMSGTPLFPDMSDLLTYCDEKLLKKWTFIEENKYTFQLVSKGMDLSTYNLNNTLIAE